MLGFPMAWVLVTSRQYPIFSRAWLNQAFHEDQKRSLGMGFDSYKSLYNGIYADGKELAKLSRLLVKKAERDPRAVWRMCGAWEKSCKEAVAAAAALEKKSFSESPDERLIEELERVVRVLRKGASYIFLHHALDPYFESWLKGLLERKGKADQLSSLIAPRRRTGLSEAHTELKRITAAVRKGGYSAAKKKIARYTRKYRWLGYDTALGNDLTREETKSKIEDVLLSGKSPSPRRKRLQLSARENDRLSLMQEIAYLTSLRSESHMKAGPFLRPLLEEIARRLSVSYDVLVRFTPDEIKEGLRKGKIDEREAEKRKERFGYVMLGGRCRVISGSGVSRYEEKKEKRTHENLKGLPAYPGLARGPVRIVLGRADFWKVRPGDILVSKTTKEDFVLVLHRCAGIITDIGGVTSHAAVIARELRKPCITATQHATHALKDGDLVEMDAARGVVRIKNVGLP